MTVNWTFNGRTILPRNAFQLSSLLFDVRLWSRENPETIMYVICGDEQCWCVVQEPFIGAGKIFTICEVLDGVVKEHNY